MMTLFLLSQAVKQLGKRTCAFFKTVWPWHLKKVLNFLLWSWLISKYYGLLGSQHSLYSIQKWSTFSFFKVYDRYEMILVGKIFNRYTWKKYLKEVCSKDKIIGWEVTISKCMDRFFVHNGTLSQNVYFLVSKSFAAKSNTINSN